MEKFTEEYIENIRNVIAENNEEVARELLKDLHPADIAELYQNLDIEEAEFLYKLLDQETAADVLMEKGLLLHIFYEYLSRVNASKLFVWDTPPFMQTMEQYLDDHLTDDINLRQMAQVVHLHPNYFIRIFKRYFHVPPMEYIQMKRLEYAASLMREHKDMTIEEVGYRCGFHDYRYFGRAVKKRYGITPSMYRTVSLGGTEPCAP